MAPSRRPRRLPVDLPDRLLACTTTIIRRHGLKFVSLRAVARCAKVSHGAPAYYYRNKAALLTAYAAQGYQRLSASARAVLATVGDDGRDQLAALGQAYVGFALANPEQFSIMFRSELHDREDPELRVASDASFAILSGAIGACVQQGHLGGADAPTVAVAAWSLTHGLAQLWLDERLQRRQLAQVNPATLARSVTELFVRSVMPDRPPK